MLPLKNTISKRDLIAEVNRLCYFSNKHEVEYVLNAIQRVIVEALLQGKTIKLNGFLKIGTKETKPRKCTLKGKKFETESKTVAYTKVSPVINRKIQEFQNLSWLDIFASYSEEVQYAYVKEAKRQIEAEKSKLQ